MPQLPSEDLDHVLAHTSGLWDAMRGSSLFVTGGTGFVGRWLVESLCWANEQLGAQVSAVLLTRDPEAFRAEAPHIAGKPWIRLHRGDVCSFEYPEDTFDFVIHAATARSFKPDSRRPLSTFDQDIEGTRRVLDLARQRGAERFLFTSSGAVYGKQPPDLSHIPEEYAGAPSSTDTASAYGQAKRVSEFMCTMHAQQYGFSAAIARLFAFVGPRLPLGENFAVGNFIRDVLGGGPVRIAGDGTPYRSYLYAADLAIWLWTILMKGQSARPYNVGSGTAVNIRDLARAVVDATAPGTKIECARTPVAGQPAARYVPSPRRAEIELGLRSLIPLDEGVRRTYFWNQPLLVSSIH